MQAEQARIEGQLSGGGGGADGPIRHGSGQLIWPVNGPITAHRKLALGSASLSDVKFIKSAFGATVNDVVMASCAGGLR